MVAIANFIIDLIHNMCMWALNILPDSPLRFTLDDSVRQYIAYANYFIPFSLMLDVTLAYVAAVSVWYFVRWIMRMIRYVQ
ncbi:hypothetical protein [Bacillus smithii]|uniref:hypothetical protein n=1 Tax=Bacillus smithii TaxID=1479 RepID=UPI003D255520